LVATNFIVGRCTDRLGLAESFFCPLEYARTYFAGISNAHRDRVLAACGSSDVANAGFHANQPWWHIGKPLFDLAA
jgi:hypothetical protein